MRFSRPFLTLSGDGLISLLLDLLQDLRGLRLADNGPLALALGGPAPRRRDGRVQGGRVGAEAARVDAPVAGATPAKERGKGRLNEAIYEN